MRRALLDVNVLLALLDSDHVDHDRAHDWLDDEIAAGWASCPITENGFVRVLSQPRYPSPVPPAQAIALLSRARLGGHHAFWPCDVSVLDAQIVDRSPTARSTPGDRRLPARPGGGARRAPGQLRPLRGPRLARSTVPPKTTSRSCSRHLPPSQAGPLIASAAASARHRQPDGHR